MKWILSYLCAGRQREHDGDTGGRAGEAVPARGDGKRMSVKSFIARHLRPQRPAPQLPPVEEALAPLAEPFRGVLLSMYAAGSMLGSDGRHHPVDTVTRITPTQGMRFFELCCSMKADATLEVGFAYGFSTMYFLAAAAANGVGHHTAIDPFEESDWHGIGLVNVRATGLQSSFRYVNDCSVHAATDLARQKSAFDVIFIDGNHRLDDVLVDFYLCAPLCRIGGLVIFDDMWMSSIQTVVSFVRSNRHDFVEEAVGDARISVFRRTGEDLRRWDDFQPFAVAGNGRAGR